MTELNLPVGELLKQGIVLTAFDRKKELSELADSNFSGYVIATINGYDGIEEGILIYRKGTVIGALYQYDKHDVTVYGDSAVPQATNSFAAKFGVVDLVKLTTQQAELITAFHDRLKLSKALEKKAILKSLTKEFSEKYAKSALFEVMREEKSRLDIFKKLGLSGLGGE